MRYSLMVAALLCSAACAAQDKVTVVVNPAPAQVVDAAHAATPEQIREYFAVTKTDMLMKKLMSNMVQAMKATAAPYIPASFWDDMEHTMREYDFMSELVPIYQKHLSRDDMGAVLAFYRSDAGKHLLENQAAMSGEAQKAFGAIGERLGEQVGERHADEIEAAKKKYEEGIANRQNLNLNVDPK